MLINTKVFGEVEVDDEKIITFKNGIIGFPDLTQFALLHNEETGNQAGIHWMQSIQEVGFALPVMDPLYVKEEYNPEVDDEMLSSLGTLDMDNFLILVTVTVPSDLTKMTVNLKAPIIINALDRKACQVIVEGDEYHVKFPIYDILQAAKKAGE